MTKRGAVDTPAPHCGKRAKGVEELAPAVLDKESAVLDKESAVLDKESAVSTTLDEELAHLDPETLDLKTYRTMYRTFYRRIHEISNEERLALADRGLLPFAVRPFFRVGGGKSAEETFFETKIAVHPGWTRPQATLVLGHFKMINGTIATAMRALLDELPMSVTVATQPGTVPATVSLAVRLTDTIDKIKDELVERGVFDRSAWDLEREGRCLYDNHSLEEYGVVDGATLRVVCDDGDSDSSDLSDISSSSDFSDASDASDPSDASDSSGTSDGGGVASVIGDAQTTREIQRTMWSLFATRNLEIIEKGVSDMLDSIPVPITSGARLFLAAKGLLVPALFIPGPVFRIQPVLDAYWGYVERDGEHAFDSIYVVRRMSDHETLMEWCTEKLRHLLIFRGDSTKEPAFARSMWQYLSSADVTLMKMHLLLKRCLLHDAEHPRDATSVHAELTRIRRAVQEPRASVVTCLKMITEWIGKDPVFSRTQEVMARLVAITKRVVGDST